MVITLELPLRHPVNTVRPALAQVATSDSFGLYQQRFGALPAWFDEIPTGEARRLAGGALRRGIPLAATDWLA